MKSSHKRQRRRGSILVLTAIMMVLMFGVLALAVDLGYVTLVRTQLQAAADSAAMAATWDLLRSHFVKPETTAATAQSQAQGSARYYAGNNRVAGETSSALADDDITFGRLDLTGGRDATMTFVDPNVFNAARIRVRRSADQNGEVPLFFVRVLGINTAASQAVAIAAYCDNFQGFKPPAADDKGLPILPFALDKETWDKLLERQTGDDWSWNENTRQITPGQDGVREANLYPQGTGSPGNRGTVDIGSPNNSTKDLSRQIRDGINANDLSYFPNGILQPGFDGTIELNGDTGMSAGIKDDLASIIGKTRIVPIFNNVAKNGNRAQYTIVQFVGVRVLAVDMTGKASSRYVMIQPATMLIDYGIPAPDGTPFSQNLYSKHVWLVR